MPDRNRRPVGGEIPTIPDSQESEETQAMAWQACIQVDPRWRMRLRSTP